MSQVVWHRQEDVEELKDLSYLDYVSIGVGRFPVEVVLDGCFSIAELLCVIAAMQRLEHGAIECQPQEPS